MKKCLVAPDAFKGCLTSQEVAQVIKESILQVYPECFVGIFPLADGGEGTVTTYAMIHEKEKSQHQVKNESFNEIEANYIINHQVAVIEMAEIVGLPRAQTNKSVLDRSTYGVGQLIETVIDKGCKKIYVGLGGSSTVDFGIGMTAALGGIFYDQQGKTVEPLPRFIGDIVRVDLSIVREKLKGIEIIGLSDVTNPIFGKKGGIAVFSPQKGASAEELKALQKNIRKFVKCLPDFSDQIRFGAAGCVGAAIVHLLGGKLESGIEFILNELEFYKYLKDADLVITGEGSFDQQSFSGKAISGIAKSTKKAGVPLMVIAGQVVGDISQCYQMGVTSVQCINKSLPDFEDYQLASKKGIEYTMKDILNVYKNFSTIFEEKK